MATPDPEAPHGTSGADHAVVAEINGKEVSSVAFRSALVAIRSFLHRDEQGQGLAEYALILALIAIASIVALMFMGNQVSDKMSIIGSTLGSVAN